jgi:hypothetical protein
VLPVAALVFVVVAAALTVLAAPSAEPVIPAPVNFRKALLSVDLANMISSLSFFDSRLPAEAANRTLKQTLNNVKREFLTVHFSKTDAAGKPAISGIIRRFAGAGPEEFFEVSTYVCQHTRG